jgi:hypothetical protein
MAVCKDNDRRPHLSAAEVLRIADTKARSVLRRDLGEFRRLPPRYSKEINAWTVVYRNAAHTAPSDVTIEVSDITREASVSFGDGSK